MCLTWSHWCSECVSFDEIEFENIQSGLICSGDVFFWLDMVGETGRRLWVFVETEFTGLSTAFD